MLVQQRFWDIFQSSGSMGNYMSTCHQSCDIFQRLYCLFFEVIFERLILTFKVGKMDRLTETEELKSSMMLESIVEIGGNMVKPSIQSLVTFFRFRYGLYWYG